MHSIEINPVTRVEGHAKVTIELDAAGEVERARFHVLEFRGFEKMCEGRPFHEMPGIMARVCGICPVSHILASSKAGDRLLGVEVPRAAVLQRRLANYAQLLQSHALSFFHLASPDFLLGMDFDPAKRNIFGLVEREPELARRGIRLRQFGQRVIELVGGRRIHPSWSIPGGVARVLAAELCQEIRAWIPEAFESVQLALGRLKGVLDSVRPEIENLGNFPSLFLGMVDEEGHLAYYDGRLRISDSEGNIVADRLDPARYATYLAEATEPWSFMKFAFYKPMGYPGGSYRVGPLARLNVATAAGTARADKELREFKQRSSGAVCESFHFHLARVIEMLHAVEAIEIILDEPDLLSEDIRARAQLNRRQGIGASEAPRGTLFHHYEVDDDGLIVRANLLIATLQNNLAINKAVEQASKFFIRGKEVKEGMLNRIEAAIRCYDPCLSCSTHAIGKMALVVDVHDDQGALVHRVER